MIIVDISVENMTPFVMWAYAKIPSPSKKKIIQQASLDYISIVTLTPPPFMRASVSSQESDRSRICVLGVLMFPLSTILDCGDVRTLWYYLFFL